MSDAGSSTTTPKWDQTKFWKEQNFQQSARLTLQHWIWSYQLGYVLHPKIEIATDENVRIADVACGNGAWVLDLARQRSNASFDGFDITTAHFPAAEFLPANIKFHQWDAFSELPGQFVGVYDVVHIRTLNSVIVDNHVDPVLGNILKMLKPGGYVQWDEIDTGTQTCTTPSGVEAPATQALVKFFNMYALSSMSKLYPDWLHQLPTTLQSLGCDIVVEQRITPSTSLQRAWCDNFLTVWMNVIPALSGKSVPLPDIDGLPKVMNQRVFAGLWEQAVEECAKGAWINSEQVVVVVRKA